MEHWYISFWEQFINIKRVGRKSNKAQNQYKMQTFFVSTLVLLWLTISCLCYDYSSLDDILDHPRLILTNDRIEEVKELNKTDSTFKQILLNVQALADEVLLESVDTGVSITLGNVGSVAAMYALTKETKYSDWITEELLALASKDTWYDTQFLTVANTAYGFNLAYDWIYDALNDTSRELIETAIIRNTIEASLGDTILTTSGTYVTNYWTTEINNWSFVCNGALFLSAMNVADTNKTMAEAQLNLSLPQLALALEAFAPDGGWYEGYNYGIYGTTYLLLGLAGLDSAIEEDFGISETTGLSRLGAWKTNNFGSNGWDFAWADNQSPITGLGNLWDIGFLEKKYHSEPVGWLAGITSRFPVENMTDFRAVLWYEGEYVNSSYVSLLPLQTSFNNTMQTIFRNSWEDQDSWVAGIRGGFNGRSHGFLDCGSFFLERNGTKWGTGVYIPSYNLTGYFDEGLRYSFYNTQSQGQNTLCISNETQKDLHFENQVISANTTLLLAGNNGAGSFFGITNLTEAYNHTTSVLRGAALVNNQFILRDEITADEEVDVLTNWHTLADVSLESSQKAILTLDGNTLIVELTSPSNGHFELVTTDPCLNTTSCTQQVNTGVTNLVVRLPSMVKSAVVQVVAHEVHEEVSNFNSSLKNWMEKLETTDNWEGVGYVDPYWLENAVRYY